MLRRRCSTLVVALSTFVMVVAGAPTGIARPAGSDARPQLANRSLSFKGTVNIRRLGAQQRLASRSSVRATASGLRSPRQLRRPLTRGAASMTAGPSVANSTIVQGSGGAQSLDGLTASDQRLADNGNQFTFEPPDGATCEGNGVGVEYVNSVLQFYDSSSEWLSAPISATDFYGLPVPIDRSKGTYGPFLPGDIKCVYDAGTGRFFLEAWATGQDFFTGNFNGQNVFFIGVQATSDPLGDYFIYALQLSSPGSPGCVTACLADHPTASTDANTYVTTYNEYNADTGMFNGARVVVLSKADLEAGAASPVVIISPGSLGGGLLYTLQGGNVPPGGGYASARGGTMYFLSALEFTGAGDTRIAVEALTHTGLIDSNPSGLGFQKKVIFNVLRYVSPPKTPQRPGKHPLGLSLGEPLNALDSGGDETQPTKFAGGKLWTVIDTQVGSGTSSRGGLLYVVVKPWFSNGLLQGHVTSQGYVAIRGNWLLYGGIAVKGNGSRPVIVTSIAGPDFYPSSGFGWLTSTGVSKIFLYGKGAGPDDGFSCYPEFDPGASTRGCRFGDYNEINWGDDGNFYFESEYVTARFRAPFANWGTRVGVLGG